VLSNVYVKNSPQHELEKKIEISVNQLSHFILVCFSFFTEFNPGKIADKFCTIPNDDVINNYVAKSNNKNTSLFSRLQVVIFYYGAVGVQW
jgi:hypothetical protein